MQKFRSAIISIPLLCIGFFALWLDNQVAAQVKQDNTIISQRATLSPRKHPADGIESLLNPVRQKYGVPALAASVVRSDGSIVSAATGVRVQGREVRVTDKDKFSIGSITKPMTATVIATFVEQGKLAWTTRPSDVFPEFKNAIHPTLKDITLEQLLAHRAGIMAFEDDKDIAAAPEFNGNATQQRLAFTNWLLQREAVVAPGSKKVYSNAGYAIAAAMAERVSGQSFETLMRKRLFKPLGMKSAGFGWAARKDSRQPWAHRASSDGFVPHNPNDSYQIGARWMPAGDVHCNMKDLAKFAAFHLRALNGKNSILRAETVKKLHMPYGGAKSGYSLGWNVNSFGHSHLGGTGTFSAMLVLFPKENFAMAVAMNTGGGKDDEVQNKVIDALLEQYKPK
ncbi:MAG: serine hydrolase domain-containing protein [Pyrinomonadaceae bacterium]